MSEVKKFTKKDFSNDQDVKWCPGCGDYAILSATQMALAQIGKAPHEIAVVSGIGCSSRFPYYMGTYGLHSIHGRAPAFATGLKIQNPELSVWLITGDGDGLSIGGNHLAHIIRRNVDVNILLFNNEIYGLTKGQYSPTSQQGLKTKSTPYGSVDRPFSPMKFALGSGSTFFARTIDTDPKHMIEVFKAAEAHRGTSVVEIYQNCVIFNDKVHDSYTNRKTRDDYSVRVSNGEKYNYGKEKDKFLDLVDLQLKESKNSEFVHDETNTILSHMLSDLTNPVPLGVLRKVEAPVYDEDVNRQIKEVTENSKVTSVQELLMSGSTWKVD